MIDVHILVKCPWASDTRHERQFARVLPFYVIPSRRVHEEDKCLTLWTISTLFVPMRDVDDVLECAVPLDLGAYVLECTVCVWDILVFPRLYCEAVGCGCEEGRKGRFVECAGGVARWMVGEGAVGMLH